MTNASTTVVPQHSDSKPSKSTSYEIAQTIGVSREEWRNQRLHELAIAFESAFDALEARP